MLELHALSLLIRPWCYRIHHKVVTYRYQQNLEKMWPYRVYSSYVYMYLYIKKFMSHDIDESIMWTLLGQSHMQMSQTRNECMMVWHWIAKGLLHHYKLFMFACMGCLLSPHYMYILNIGMKHSKEGWQILSLYSCLLLGTSFRPQ